MMEARVMMVTEAPKVGGIRVIRSGRGHCLRRWGENAPYTSFIKFGPRTKMFFYIGSK